MFTKEQRDSLRKKLTSRSAGQEAFSAILGGFNLFILILAALALDGWLMAGVVYMVVMTLLGFVLKMVGWRSISLTNDEQEFLNKNYNL